eukprot:jgi/Phyca11/65948/gw1.10.438.1
MEATDEHQVVPVYNLEETRVSSRQVSAKRSREEDPGLAPTTGDSRLIALRRRLGDDPDMVRDIDQLLALRQADLGKGSSSSLSKSKEFDYLPHPGAARGFYGWDFGFRGLSVMHFSPVDVDEERDYRRRYDMTDFSVKNKLPEPPKATAIIDVVAALEVLALLVKEMYQPMVGDLIDGARRFLLLLRKTNFRFNHESYARVVQRVTSLKVEAVLKSTVSRKVDSRQKIQQRRSKGNHHAATIPVPPAVVAALPIRKGKKLCMKFLSTNVGHLPRHCRWRVSYTHGGIHPEDVGKPLHHECRTVVSRAVIENHSYGIGKPLHHECRTVVGPKKARAYAETVQRRYMSTWGVRERLFSLQQDITWRKLQVTLASYGIPPPSVTSSDRVLKFRIGRAKQTARSELLRRSTMKLPDLIRLVRGETTSDPRPN